MLDQRSANRASGARKQFAVLKATMDSSVGANGYQMQSLGNAPEMDPQTWTRFADQTPPYSREGASGLPGRLLAHCARGTCYDGARPQRLLPDRPSLRGSCSRRVSATAGSQA
jgi:hypothetical protein